MLALNGYTNTETHITEINRELNATSPYYNTPKGAAYIASSLLTAQESHIHKFFWYRGTVLPGYLFFDDSGGSPNLTYNGYSYKIMNYLVFEAPTKLTTTGNEVVEFNREKDTTNLMIAAGKSTDGKKVYVMISNFKSYHTQYDIVLNNLPWNSSQTIEVTKNTLKTGSKFTETKTTMTGGSSFTLTITNPDSPSVYLLRLSPVQGIISGTVTYKNSSSSPLPAVTVKAVPAAGGTELTTTTNSSGAFTFSNLSDGVYYIQPSLAAAWNGVNSTDALMIRQYLVGQKTLDSLQFKAADVNKSGTVNSTDALIVRQRVVGIITSFVAGDWVFENPAVTVSSGYASVSINGLCTGDVNGSFVPVTTKKTIKKEVRD